MPQVNEKSPVLWIITEGMIGTENQCLGVAEAIGITPIVKRVSLREPWKTLSPWLPFECALTFTEKLNAPWPDILMTAGRKAVAASRYIKRMSGEKTFTIHLQNPHVSPKNFDLLAVPFHDDVRGNNVIVTDGAPNRITTEKLMAAKEKWRHTFECLPAPRVAVMIGGNSKTHQLTPDIITHLCAQLKNLNMGLMITASRRTGEENLNILKQHITAPHFLWDGVGDNPYHGMLGWADYILVTEDSVSMISDAATTGKPVHIIPLKGKSSKFNRFHDHMKDIGATREFTGTLENWAYPALNDSKKIADIIKEKTRL